MRVTLPPIKVRECTPQKRAAKTRASQGDPGGGFMEDYDPLLPQTATATRARGRRNVLRACSVPSEPTRPEGREILSHYLEIYATDCAPRTRPTPRRSILTGPQTARRAAAGHLEQVDGSKGWMARNVRAALGRAGPDGGRSCTGGSPRIDSAGDWQLFVLLKDEPVQYFKLGLRSRRKSNSRKRVILARWTLQNYRPPSS